MKNREGDRFLFTASAPPKIGRELSGSDPSIPLRGEDVGKHIPLLAKEGWLAIKNNDSLRFGADGVVIPAKRLPKRTTPSDA